MSECGHDGWVEGCPICERESKLAAERIEREELSPEARRAAQAVLDRAARKRLAEQLARRDADAVGTAPRSDDSARDDGSDEVALVVEVEGVEVVDGADDDVGRRDSE